jgi:Kinesin motor domain
MCSLKVRRHSQLWCPVGQPACNQWNVVLNLQEEIHDLLLAPGQPQPAISIREMPNGSMCIAGATDIDIDLTQGSETSKRHVFDLLMQGTMSRATSMTLMNARSSRSHAVFSLTLEQRRESPMDAIDASSEQDGDRETGNSSRDEKADGGPDLSYLCAKMLLVDLAGSERVKRTGATGARLQEGIHINQGADALPVQYFCRTQLQVLRCCGNGAHAPAECRLSSSVSSLTLLFSRAQAAICELREPRRHLDCWQNEIDTVAAMQGCCRSQMSFRLLSTARSTFRTETRS